MASVYRARDREVDRTVAVKVLHDRSAHLEQRFARESKLLHDLSHPAIVRYFDSGVTPGNRRYLVMEWLEGVDLTALLQSRRLAIADSLALIGRIASALAFAHDRGVVHRDVKPSNIFLPGGEVSAAKLLDFGVARWASAADTLTKPGARFGTPGYMSPEQVRGVRHLNPRTDTFSLGCVLFECLTGEPAFAAGDAMAVFCKILMDPIPTVRAFVPDIPDRIDELVQCMLAKRSGSRPPLSIVVDEVREIAASLASSSLSDQRAASYEREAITRAEQRIVHVVVAASGDRLLEVDRSASVLLEAFQIDGSPRMLNALTDLPPGESELSSAEPSAEHSPELGEDEPPSSGDQHPLDVRLETMPGWQATTARLDRVSHQMALLGARFNVLADGSAIIVLDNRGAGSVSAGAAAVDQAANAARCALILRDELPGAAIAVAGARAVIERERLVGSVIERAVELLRDAETAAESMESLRETIRIDALSAALLGPKFHVDETAEGGYYLYGEQRSLAGDTPLSIVTPFVGRKRDLKKLTRALDDCIEDEVAQAVLITGPAGFGKSRLGREFLAQVEKRDDDIEIWLAHADPMRATTPLHIIADMVRFVTGVVQSQPTTLSRDQLRIRVERYVDGPDALRLTVFLGELLGLPTQGSEREDVQLAAARHDPKLMGDQVRRACLDLLDVASSRGPLLLVIEDLHWADRSSLQLLDRALRSLAERPFMVLALSRPEIHDSFPGLWSDHGVAEFRLGRLPIRAAVTLVHEVLGPDLEPDRVDAIVERADGNAFYLEELVRHAESGQWALPDTVAAMVQAGLDELDPEARQVLRGASVFGEAFWRGGVAALMGDEIDVDEWLHNLTTLEYVARAPVSRFAAEPQYTFRHAIIRDTVYEMLTEADRRLAHRLAGAWLEEIGEPHNDVVADHFVRGNAPELAMPFYVRAAEDALNRSDLQTAVDMAERGIECGARGSALGQLRRVEVVAEIWRGNTRRVAEQGTAALELLLRDSRAWYEVAGETATAWTKLGEHERAEEIAAMLLEPRQDEASSVGRLLALAKVSHEMFATERGARAAELLDAVEAEIADVDKCPPVLAANVYLGWALRADTTSADPGAVVEALEHCARSFEEVGDVRQACLHRGNVGYSKMELGLYEEAERDLRAALATAEQLGIGFATYGIRRQLALVLAHRGSFAEAEAMGRRARDWFVERQDSRYTALCNLFLASIHLMAENLAEAESEARAALARLPEAAPLRARALATLARIHLIQGHPGPAFHAAAEALNLMESIGSVESSEFLVRLVYAQALQASGEEGAAIRKIAQARDLLVSRATQISRPEWRASFLENVPENKEILRLAGNQSA